MRFLAINRLKSELRSGSLSDHDAFFYFFAVLIVETLIISSTFAFPGKDEFSWLDMADVLAPTFIVTAATYILYLTNGGKNGEHFFLRYFSILWVVGVRFTFLIPILLIVWIRYFSLTDGESVYDWGTFALHNMFHIFFYWRVWVHMREVQVASGRSGG